MNSVRFRKIEEIYYTVREMPPEKQSLFLEKECGADFDLRKEIELMLSFENKANSFIDSSPEEFVAEMFSGGESDQSLVNKEIGRYKVEKILGEGGMGTVYLATDSRLARPVALKVLPAEMVKNSDRVQRFIHEARSASALNHPNILTVYEIGEFQQNDADKIHYISMEFVDGQTLQHLIYLQETPLKDLLKYLSQVAQGLSKAHAAGIIHRDLKPENIMVSVDGFAKILDFGLAKLTDKEHELHQLQEHKSRPGVILGTLGYMSPEQAQGKKDIDERSDIFSFGCILYEAIAGRQAFEAETTIDALHQIVHSAPIPITDYAPDISNELKDLIEKCLQKKPENRYRHINDVLPLLQKVLTKGISEKHALVSEQRTAVFDKAQTNPTISKQFSKERRQVTTMFVDISAISEMLEDFDPEESSQITKQLWDFLDDLIIEGGGKISERFADTILAIWGTDSVQENDPDKSVRTGLELQKKVSNYFNRQISGMIELSEVEKEELEQTYFLRIGISTGTVLVGNSRDTGEFVTRGSAVNVAKRMLSYTSVGEIFISHHTYQHIRGVFETEEVNPNRKISIKQQRPQSKIYSIKGIKPRAFRLESRGVEGVETLMVGRKPELLRMFDSLEAVTEDKELQIVTVVGEAGLGKSRLLFEFQDKIDLLPDKFFVFKTRALETMQGVAYSMVRDLFQFRFEIRESDSKAVSHEKFVTGILELTTATPDQFGTGEKAEMKAHFIGQLIGFDFSESEYIKGLIDDEKQISDRALLYAAQFFSAVAKRFPIVFYLDDLHWADNESLNFFDFIAQKCVDEPILITEFTRPILFEKRPHWGEGQDNRVRLNLRPLTKRESHKLVRSILQKAEAIPKTLLDLLVSSTEGNPFYVEELIKMFIEVKVIKTTQDKWVVDTNRLGEITVPPTLTGVLQSRLDKLSNWEKRVLQRASIIGREFWENSLGEFDEEVNLRTILESLRKKELLFRKESSAFADTTEYIFKHALLRDVTYETVLLEERQKWHSETAEWLIRTVTDRENEYLAVIAEHFEKAKDSEKSAIWFGKAGGQALKIYALEIAESYFRKALAFGDFVSKHEPPSILTPQTVMKWKHRLGKVLFEQARFSEAIEIFEDVLETAIGLDDKLGQAYAYWGLSFSQFDLGEIRSSLVSSKEVIRVVKDNDLAKSEEGSFLLSTGLYRQGRALLSLGKFDEVISIAEKILEITNSSEYSDSSVKANGFHLLASANLFLGRFKEAQKYEKQEVEISREIDDKRTIGNGLNSLGFQSYMQGDGKEAIRYYEEAYEIATEIGNQTGAIMVKSNIGGAKVYLGDYQSAESELKKIIAEVGDHGHFLVPEMYRFLTESLIGQGKFKEALETAKKSLTLSEESESREMIGEAWRVLGISLSCLKQDTLVSDKKISPEDCFRKSLTIFEEIGMEANYAQVLDNFASHKLSVGETEKAGELAAREQEISNRLDINTKAKNKYFNNLKN